MDVVEEDKKMVGLTEMQGIRRDVGRQSTV